MKSNKRNDSHRKKERLNELFDMVVSTSEAKGWKIHDSSIDEKNWRYATLTVSRTHGYEAVTALIEISHNDKISISCEKTSFHGYGVNSLGEALRDGMDTISWLKPIKKSTAKEKPDLLDALYQMLRRFDMIVRQLGHRHADREPIEVRDEYDVQYVLHALLRGLFSDVRPEEVSPSYAGASSRIDFLLKDEKVVVETKMASASLKDKKIGEQLIIDIERYQAHPDCRRLVCLVYDPNNCIHNPAGIERDLSRKTDKTEVIVFVVPH